MHTAHYVRACARAPKCVHVLRVLIVTERIRYEYYTWPSIVPYIPRPTRSRLDSCARRNERGASLAAKVTETARTGAAVGRGRERFSSIWRRCMAILAHRVHTYTPRHAVVARGWSVGVRAFHSVDGSLTPTARSALHVFQTTQNTTCLGNALQAVSNLI